MILQNVGTKTIAEIKQMIGKIVVSREVLKGMTEKQLAEYFGADL